jgi:tRNA-dihydrouridine synthase
VDELLTKAVGALLSETGAIGVLLVLSVYLNWWLLRKLVAYMDRDRTKSETQARKYHELANELKELAEDLTKHLGKGER